MDLTTYSGLQSAVADYLGRADLTEQIPAFVRLAETRLNRELRLRCMEKRATASVAAGEQGIALPAKRVDGAWDVFMEMRDLAWVADGAGAEPANMRYMPPDEYFQGISRSGTPGQYTIIGTDVFLCPAPDVSGTLHLAYYAEIPPLSAIQTTNLVLQQFPDLYVYAALVESVPYTRGSAPAAIWTQYYSAARDRAEQQEQRARFTANLAMRPCRRI